MNLNLATEYREYLNDDFPIEIYLINCSYPILIDRYFKFEAKRCLEALNLQK